MAGVALDEMDHGTNHNHENPQKTCKPTLKPRKKHEKHETTMKIHGANQKPLT